MGVIYWFTGGCVSGEHAHLASKKLFDVLTIRIIKKQTSCKAPVIQEFTAAKPSQSTSTETRIETNVSGVCRAESFIIHFPINIHRNKD